jgi:uncharacterized coiled-coil DUF342 family protein
MSRSPRDRAAEKAAIAAASQRLLAGTPLRSTTGKLTVTELITESGLRRDVVYEHDKADKVVETFKALVKARHYVPEAMLQLADENQRLHDELTTIKQALAAERSRAKLLAQAAAELSLELEQAREQLTVARQVTRLPIRYD